jgi:hypothetical protein
MFSCVINSLTYYYRLCCAGDMVSSMVNEPVVQVQTSVLVDRVHLVCRPLIGLLYHPRMLDDWNIWWNESWQGKPKYSEKTCPSAQVKLKYIGLDGGGVGFRVPVRGKFSPFHVLQTGCGDTQPSIEWLTGGGGNTTRSVKLTSLQLVPSLRKLGSILPLLHTPSCPNYTQGQLYLLPCTLSSCGLYMYVKGKVDPLLN